jgi:hypothetical protein
MDIQQTAIARLRLQWRAQLNKTSKVSNRFVLGLLLAGLGVPACTAESEPVRENQEALACIAPVETDRAARQDLFAQTNAASVGAVAPSGAELAALPAAQPSSSIVPVSCSCETVTVHCTAPLPPDVAGECRRSICDLSLSPTSCAQFNLHDGQVIDPRQLIGYDQPPPAPQDPEDYCAVKHEARHACDQPIAVPDCETEQNAYMTDYACLKNRFDANCSPFPAQSGALFAYCNTVRGELQGVLAAAEFNHCVCLPNKTCAQCTSDCYYRKPQVEICSGLSKYYCGDQNGAPPAL